MRLKIRSTHAVAILAAATVIAIVLSVTFLLLDLRKRELAHAKLETMSLTRMFMEQTEKYFENADLVLLGVQERLQTNFGQQVAIDGASVHLLLGSRVSGLRQVSALFLVNADGMVVNSSRDYPRKPQSVSDRNYFKVFAEGKSDALFIDKPTRSRNDGRWTIHLARSFNGPDGKFRGVVVAAVNISQFESHYNFMALDYPRPMSIYLSDGTLIASVPHRENVIGDRAMELNGEQIPAPGEDVRIVNHVGGDQSRQVFALGRVSRYPLLVSVGNDEEESLASWRETAVPIGLGAGLVCIFVVIVAVALILELQKQESLSRALREANDRYHHTVDSVMDAILAIDDAQNIVLFNPAAERMFGLPAHEAIGKPLAALIPERMRASHVQHIARFVHSDATSRSMAPGLEIFGLRVDGTEFPVESTISHTLVDGRPQLTAVLRDVTERRRAVEELRQMNRQLRELSASLQDVREQERTRIARELHDELGQQLTGLKLDLSWLNARLKEGRPAPPERLNEMRQLLDSAITSVRRISTDLRPPILDDLGFGEAVTWHAQDFARRCGLDVSLDLGAASSVRDDGLATALFRIVQESLTNVARHAEATSVDIRLLANEGRLCLTVHDDGRGLSETARAAGGIGLLSMRERAMALGAQFTIVSSAQTGTTVEVSMPLTSMALAGEAV